MTRGSSALRRAGRAAIVMPALFALGSQVIGNPTVSIFAAFGAFAMLLLVDFGGPIRAAAAGTSRARGGGRGLRLPGDPRLALARGWRQSAMAVVGFGVLFAGVVSSVLAGATVALLLAFILPVSLAGPGSSIPDRLAGWGLASAASFVAIALSCGRRPLEIRCGRPRSQPAGRWPPGCAPTSPSCSRARPGRRRPSTPP